jgi:hypothetical protein
MHCPSDAMVCLAFEVFRRLAWRSTAGVPGTLVGPASNIRYVCITGPDGRVLRDMLYSDDEIARAVESILGPATVSHPGHGCILANRSNTLEGKTDAGR